MLYSVEVRPAAWRALQKIARPDQGRIRDRIEDLKANPRPPGAKALQGEEGLLRLRVGDYRVVYMVKDEVLLVIVVRIGHRREVYRR